MSPQGMPSKTQVLLGHFMHAREALRTRATSIIIVICARPRSRTQIDAVVSTVEDCFPRVILCSTSL